MYGMRRKKRVCELMVMQVMQNYASFALYTNNDTVLEDAFTRAMAVVTVSP